ncbi:MAG: hypothetical protein M1833_007007 [Piccolia ochrophora]|nr:MAG: hypothetical protein M1833_007007 [Piccolia ochrophora]
MPRRRGAPARGAPSRPVPAPARPNVTPPQPPSRPASGVAHPGGPANQRQTAMQPQKQQSSGLFGQMASTAAGVAVGSSIGHAIGGFFGGGSAAPVEADQANAVATASQENAYQDNTWGARTCEGDARQFTKCLDENGGNMQICGWYLEQLKACQAAASQY